MNYTACPLVSFFGNRNYTILHITSKRSLDGSGRGKLLVKNHGYLPLASSLESLEMEQLKKTTAFIHRYAYYISNCKYPD